MTEEDKRSAGNPTAREEDEDQALNLPDEEEDQPSMEEIEHLMKQTGKIRMGYATFRAKRHIKKSLKEVILGITKPAIRRLARRGGVKRMSSLVYDEARIAIDSFLKDIIT